MNNDKSIEELYYLIFEDFNSKIASTKEYKDIMKESYDLLNELKSSVTDKEYNTLGNLVDKCTELTSLCQKKYFIKGFSMANQLMIESLDK